MNHSIKAEISVRTTLFLSGTSGIHLNQPGRAPCLDASISVPRQTSIVTGHAQCRRILVTDIQVRVRRIQGHELCNLELGQVGIDIDRGD